MIADLEPVQVKIPDLEESQESDAVTEAREAVDDIVGRVDPSQEESDQERLRQLLVKHARAFSFTEDDLGHDDNATPHICRRRTTCTP